jgi:hypothetical protein
LNRAAINGYHGVMMQYAFFFVLGFLAAFAVLRPLYRCDRAWDFIRDVWLRASTPEDDKDFKAW